MKKIISLWVLTLGLGYMAIANASATEIAVEPIVGYERVQKIFPTPHTSDRLMYGARARVGIPLLSLEAEYTRGSDTESFPADSLTTSDTDDKIKLGLRSSFRMNNFFSFQLRAGAQAKRNIHTDTNSGVTTQIVGPIVYNPYGGLGLTSKIAKNLEITGSVTAVFNDFPNMAMNDYQTALGLTVHFP